ncbi:MAG: DUF302 domain-containing protein [Saprospirales bacterium]|nr:DUF302 domain-containing protein [Saprospirales bacterium]
MSYYFSKVLDMNFEEAKEHTIASLKTKGFGIITEIDMKGTFQKKIDKEIRPYHILGACNPNYAFEALQKENKVGAMLPCNVIVQELENGKVEVSAVNPVASMAAIDNPELLELAGQVGGMLKDVVEGL